MRVFYKVMPHSVLFFRDPRPFTAGEQSLARLQFPPRLTPFMGALRTKFLDIESRRNGKSISDLFKDGIEDKLKTISIFWFSLMKDGEPLIPVPFDAFSRWEKLNNDRFVFDDNHPLRVPLRQIMEKEKKTPAYLSIKGFIQYLNGQVPREDEVLSFDEIYKIENRVGLTLTKDNKTSERSKFYRMSVARLKKGIEFLVGVEMDDGMLPKKFTTRLGGEGHITVWEKTNKFKEPTEESGHFRELVALTHIPIKNDGTPDYEINNWCINKLDITSGWDYREYRPKPLRKVLKPGSVLFVRRLNGAKPVVYKVSFKEGVDFMILRDFAVKKDEYGYFLTVFNNGLAEPNTLFVVKK